MTSEMAALRQHVIELETLQNTSLLIASSLDLPTVLNSIAESALALIGASDCLIYLYDSASDSFSFAAALGKWTAAGNIRAPRRSGLTATVVRRGQPVVINDAASHPLYASLDAQAWDIEAIAGFPLQRAGQVLGVLHVVFDEPQRAITPGQAVVLYDRDMVLGGAWIERAEPQKSTPVRASISK